ncbi:hypothetical protein TYRP_001703, partial [Tyrophagus putrescentiae]
WRESTAGAGAAQPRTARSETAENHSDFETKSWDFGCALSLSFLPWAAGEAQLLQGKQRLPRAAKSDVTWPLSTSDDEGLASAASKARGGGR